MPPPAPSGAALLKGGADVQRAWGYTTLTRRGRDGHTEAPPSAFRVPQMYAGEGEGGGGGLAVCHKHEVAVPRPVRPLRTTCPDRR